MTNASTPGILGLAEPAVALTDLGVAIEAATCALVIARTRVQAGGDGRRSGSIRRWLAAFFGATAVAATAGAALHAMRPDRATVARRRLWRTSLGSIAVASLAAWHLGSGVAADGERVRPVLKVVTGLHVAYLVILPVTQPPYVVAIATYLPGAVFLARALATRLGDPGWRQPAAIGLSALGVTFAAAVVQVRRISVGPGFFDHNALYHTLQAVGIGLFFGCGQDLIRIAAQPTARR